MNASGAALATPGKQAKDWAGGLVQRVAQEYTVTGKLARPRWQRAGAGAHGGQLVDTPVAAARARWLVLVAMTGAMCMLALDLTIVNVALPSMTRHLHLGGDMQQWIVNSYMLALAATVACGGKLGDRIGRTTTLCAGVIIFLVASVACGLAPDGMTLIGGRLAQGIGAALMCPVSGAIVIDAFGPRERGRAMAIYFGLGQVFMSLGPFMGGLLTQAVSWRAVFWVNVPIGLATLALVRIARPDNTARRHGTIKATDLVLLTCGLGLLVLGLQQASQWGWSSAATTGCLLTGTAALALFGRKQLKSGEPLLNLRLFGNRSFLGDSLVLGLLQFAQLPIIMYTSLYLQDLLGYSPELAGIATLPLVLPLTVTSQFGGRWFDHKGVRYPVTTGLAMLVAGIAACAAALPHLSYAWALPGMILTGSGLGLATSPATTDGLNRAPQAERAQASGLLNTVRQFCGTIGTVVVSTIILAAQHTRTAHPHLTADAISAGFAVAAASAAIALVIALRLLARTERPNTASRLSRPNGSLLRHAPALKLPAVAHA